MATKQYKECDYCHSTDIDKNNKIERIFLQTGWQPDAAGGPSEPDGKEYDLCVKCMAKLCGALLTQIRMGGMFDLNKASVKVFEEQRQKHARMGSSSRS